MVDNGSVWNIEPADRPTTAGGQLRAPSRVNNPLPEMMDRCPETVATYLIPNPQPRMLSGLAWLTELHQEDDAQPGSPPSRRHELIACAAVGSQIYRYKVGLCSAHCTGRLPPTSRCPGQRARSVDSSCTRRAPLPALVPPQRAQRLVDPRVGSWALRAGEGYKLATRAPSL